MMNSIDANLIKNGTIDDLVVVNVPDKNGGDLISRQAAIDAVADLYWMDERLLNFKKEIDATFDKIKALPSAQPEPRPKHGKWETEVRTIRGHKIAFFACSVCGRNADDEYPYCPNCGAKMGGDDWEEPEINPCRGCDDYDGRGGCKSNGGCGAERSEYVGELKLKEPLTKEDWDLIADADFKHTPKVTFTTPHCGEVEFVKVVRCKDCKYNYGKEHGGEFNPEDIVCDYWATDGLNADDFCSYAERSEDGET